EPGTIFCGDTAKNNASGFNTIYIIAIDSNAQLLWSIHSDNSNLTGSFSRGIINVENNTIALAGTYRGVLSWDNHTVTQNSFYPNGFLLLADATTGAVFQLDSISATAMISLHNTALDKNGNVY